jgi:flagellar hook-basal body complex protein FliE
MVDPIRAAAVRGLQQAAGSTATLNPGAAAGPSFGETLKRALEEVSQAQDHATDYVGKFMRGEHVELHQVMAAAEEAGIALEMLVEIRNKFTEAYRTVINMQS